MVTGIKFWLLEMSKGKMKTKGKGKSAGKAAASNAKSSLTKRAKRQDAKKKAESNLPKFVAD